MSWDLPATLNTSGLTPAQVNEAAIGIGAILEAIADEGLPDDYLNTAALRTARDVLTALVAEPEDDDGPQVFMLSTGEGDDPVLFTTLALAEGFAEACKSNGFGCRIDQQTVCGPTLAAQMIANERAEGDSLGDDITED